MKSLLPAIERGRGVLSGLVQVLTLEDNSLAERDCFSTQSTAARSYYMHCRLLETIGGHQMADFWGAQFHLGVS